MKSDFLIIGCTSAVGSRLLIRLLNQGYEVKGIRLNSPCEVRHESHNCASVDILNSDPQTISSMYPSKNLILASWISTPGVFWESPINLEWNAAYKALITEFLSNGGSKVIGIGSCAEYLFDRDGFLSELSPTEPLTTYGKSKLDLFNHLSKSEVEFLWVRTFFQYGPDEDDRKFLSSLIKKFQLNQDFNLHEPEGLRDYVYIDDVADVLMKLINKGSRGDFNIGTGCALSNYEVATLVLNALQSRSRIQICDSTSTPKHVVASTEKLEKEIGPIEWIDIESGIQKMIEAKASSQKGNGAI